MKRIIAGILVSMLMIVSILASATVVENNIELKDKKISFFEIKDGEITNTITVSSYEIESTEQGDEIFAENFGRLRVPGKPNLPSKIFSIAIPPGSEFVDINFEASDGVVLPGSYSVPPAILPKVIGEEKPEIYLQELEKYEENYNSVYQYDDPYPSSVVEFVRTAGYRKYNLVDVRVNPFTYHPLSGQMVYYPEIEIHVSYTFPEGFSTENIMIDNIPEAEQRAEKIIFNYDQAKEWYPSGQGGRDSYDYIIITLDSLVSSVSSLVDWEETKGKNVNVVTTSWINSNYNGYDLAEKIRNFLRDKYPSQSWGILDVCIVGHWSDVPMRTCWQYVYGYGPPDTDLYYAELSLPDSQSWDSDGDHRWGEDTDPIDFYSEVNIGRIPWSDPNTVEDICDKSVAYEQSDDPSFKKNILLLGAFFWDNDPNPRTDNAVLMEYKVDSSLHPWMSDWTMTRMYEQGHSTYPMDYDLTHTNVVNVWSSGSYAFVNYAGHGSPTACYIYHSPNGPFIESSDCVYLNDNYPAIIFADACSNSDTDYLNIGQAMLKQGGVGFLGSTEVALGNPGWDHPDDGSSQSLDYYFTTCVTSGDYTQGQAHQFALHEMYTNNLWDYTKYEMFEWGALWGNPDLQMGEVITSDPPAKPTIDGPDHGVYNESLTFTARTTEPNGEQLYYLFDWGDGNFSEWLGPYNSGETIEATNSWPGMGAYIVKVKAKDEQNANSEWSDPHRVEIHGNTEPEAPTIDGPTNGKVGQNYPYTVSTTDIDNHDVAYIVIWGDSESTGWSEYYPSGEEVVFNHVFKTSGFFTIQVRAKDTMGYKSDWTHLNVNMLRSRVLQNNFIFKLFEKLFNSFHILERLIL